jgi:hypothetical protein
LKPENILDMPVQHLAQNDESKVKAFIFASIFLKFTLPHKLWSAILNFVRKYWQKCQNVLNTKKELTTNREKKHKQHFDSPDCKTIEAPKRNKTSFRFLLSLMIGHISLKKTQTNQLIPTPFDKSRRLFFVAKTMFKVSHTTQRNTQYTRGLQNRSKCFSKKCQLLYVERWQRVFI